jgi:hypothetical protein
MRFLDVGLAWFSLGVGLGFYWKEREEKMKEYGGHRGVVRRGKRGRLHE